MCSATDFDWAYPSDGTVSGSNGSTDSGISKSDGKNPTEMDEMNVNCGGDLRPDEMPRRNR